MDARRVMVVLAAALTLAPAWSQTKVAIGVVSMDRGAQRHVAAVEAIADAWASGSQRLEYVDVGALARGEDVAARAKKGEEALEAYKRGLDEYDAMSYDGSLANLDRAIELFEASDLTLYLDGLLDAYAVRALALFYAGRVPEARNQLIDLHTLKPSYTFDPSRMTPDIEPHVDEARRSAEAAPPTTLEVQVTPVPGRVYVDGRYVGVTPIEVRKLTPGNHFVSVIANGYAFAQEKHLAAPGHIARFKLSQAPRGRELLAKIEGARGALRAGTLPDAAAALADWARADQVVVIGVSSSESGPVKVSGDRIAADGHYLAHGETQLNMEGDLATVASAVDAFLDGLHAVDRPRGPKGEPIKSLTDGKGMLTGIPVAIWPGAAGLAAVGGGVAMGLSAKAKQREAHAVLQSETNLYESTMKKARTNALVADLLYVVGAGGLGTAAWLYLKDRKPAEQSAPESDAFSWLVVPTPDGAVVTVGGSF